MQVIEAMEATEYAVFDYSENERSGLLRAFSRYARARATSLLWSASGCREGLSPVVAVRLRAAVIRMCTPFIRVRAGFTRLRSIFVIERPSARGLMVRRPVATMAVVLAALVLVFVPTSAVQQLTYNTIDANAGFVSGAGATGVDVVQGDSVGASADDSVGDAVGYAAGVFVGDSVGDAQFSSNNATALVARPVATGDDQLNETAAFSHLSVKPSGKRLLTEEEPLTELLAASIPLSSFATGQDSAGEPRLTEPGITAAGISAGTGSADSGVAGTVAAENLSHSEPSPESAGAYIWPADGTLTSRYGYRSTSVGSSNHKGIDISGMYGDPIYAAAGGEVIVSGWSNSFGYVIHIQHDNGDVTIYSHCSALLVSVGERVDQGQDIAKMGKTGIASGIHLHFELLINGQNVNPQSYLP